MMFPRASRSTIVVALLAGGTLLASARGRRTPAGFAYTRAQAARGATVYQARCAACHAADAGGDRNGVTPALFGADFMANWSGLPLSTLLDRIRLEAQQATPAGLSRQQQADVLAFLLEKNEISADERELPADPGVLGQVRLSDLPISSPRD